MNTLLRSAPWLTFSGTVVTLLGLAWDARLHRLDGTLAQREGVFALSNPGHRLFAVGLGLIVAGTILSLLAPALRRSGASAARRVAALAASGFLVALSVVTFAGAVAGQDGGGHDHSGQGMPAAATPEQQAAAARLLAEVKKGIAPYADLRAGLAAGYRQTTPWRFRTWGPAHFHNRALNRDGLWLEPSRPESLMYLRMRDGRIVLIGAMFVAPKGTGPRPAGPLVEWHTHDNLCVRADGTVAMAAGPGQCPPGAFFLGESVEMLHVWTFDNPDGAFAHSLSLGAIQAAVRQFGGR